MAMTWPYIAGFFDGEGNVSTPFGRTIIRVQITQAGEVGLVVLREIADFLAEHGVKSSIRHAKPIAGRKEVYILYTQATHAVEFLKAVMPYLRVKKVVSQDVVRWRRLFPGMYVSPLCYQFRAEQTRKHNAMRTHCHRGHALTNDNVYWYQHGERRSKTRSCMACAKDRANARYERIRKRRAA